MRRLVAQASLVASTAAWVSQMSRDPLSCPDLIQLVGVGEGEDQIAALGPILSKRTSASHLRLFMSP